jgi:hypothetical protein
MASSLWNWLTGKSDRERRQEALLKAANDLLEKQMQEFTRQTASDEAEANRRLIEAQAANEREKAARLRERNAAEAQKARKRAAEEIKETVELIHQLTAEAAGTAAEEETTEQQQRPRKRIRKSPPNLKHMDAEALCKYLTVSVVQGLSSSDLIKALVACEKAKLFEVSDQHNNDNNNKLPLLVYKALAQRENENSELSYKEVGDDKATLMKVLHNHVCDTYLEDETPAL